MIFSLLFHSGKENGAMIWKLSSDVTPKEEERKKPILQVDRF